jgi:hypothetical protein
VFNTLHDLSEEFVVDIHSPSFDDLLDPALAGEALVSLRIGANHLKQLLRSYKIVQNYNLFGEPRDVFFRVGHACHFALQQLVHYYDQSVGGLEGKTKRGIIGLFPIGLQVSFVTVTVFLGDFDELVAVGGPAVLSVALTLEEVVLLEG